MGFFELLKQSVLKPLEKADLLGSALPLEPGHFGQLYTASAAYTYARQLLLGEHVVKELDWNVDFSKGEISFGEDSFPIQLLGTESDDSCTWLWSWANTESNLPEAICQDALALQEIGRQHGYQQLQEPQFSFEGFTAARGHAVASVAAALHKEHVCYYRCPYQGGAAYVLVKRLPAPVFYPLNQQQVTGAISHLLQSQGGELHHKLLVLGLAKCAGLGCTEQGNEVTLRFRSGEPVTVTFDPLGRIAGITTELQP